MEQVVIFVGDGFVLFFQENEIDFFLGVWECIYFGWVKIRKCKVDYLVYVLVDNIVDQYYLLLDCIDFVLDDLEEEIFLNVNWDSKGKIYNFCL